MVGRGAVAWPVLAGVREVGEGTVCGHRWKLDPGITSLGTVDLSGRDRRLCEVIVAQTVGLSAEQGRKVREMRDSVGVENP